MNFYVPTIGDSIYLIEPWTFTLHQEGRNEGLAKRLAQCGQGDTHTVSTNSVLHKERMASGNWEDLGSDDHHWKDFTWKNKTAEVVLPIGTQLKVDRIYIKSTYRDFDSITFRIGKCEANPKLEKARFWVKLKDANKIVCDLYPVVDKDAAKLFPRDQRFASIGLSE